MYTGVVGLLSKEKYKTPFVRSVSGQQTTQREEGIWPIIRHKAFWELESSTVSSSYLIQSQAAEPLTHSDLLPRLQVKTKVFGGFKQKNDGGTHVKLSHCLPFL